MKANLIISICEVVIRDYSLIEDTGIISHVGTDITPNTTFEYEDDEENPGKHMIVIKGKSLEDVLKFLDFTEILVKIVT